MYPACRAPRQLASERVRDLSPVQLQSIGAASRDERPDLVLRPCTENLVGPFAFQEQSTRHPRRMNARLRNSPPWRRPSWSMPWPTPSDRCHSTATPSWASPLDAWNRACGGIRSSLSPCTSKIGGGGLLSANKASDLGAGGRT